MKRTLVALDELTFVGLTVRTNNQNEMTPGKGKIGSLCQDYFHNGWANKIVGRVTPGITYSVYTEFESDEYGEYSYLVGELVSAESIQTDDAFKIITVPACQYDKFTTDEGEIPGVVISAWQEIWSMDKSDFSAPRAYRADFEVYDERAIDPKKTILDIYIGVDG